MGTNDKTTELMYNTYTYQACHMLCYVWYNSNMMPFPDYAVLPFMYMVQVLRTDTRHDNRKALAPFSKSTLQPLLIAKIILKKLPPIILHRTYVQCILYDLG